MSRRLTLTLALVLGLVPFLAGGVAAQDPADLVARLLSSDNPQALWDGWDEDTRQLVILYTTPASEVTSHNPAGDLTVQGPGCGRRSTQADLYNVFGAHLARWEILWYACWDGVNFTHVGIPWAAGTVYGPSPWRYDGVRSGPVTAGGVNFPWLYVAGQGAFSEVLPLIGYEIQHWYPKLESVTYGVAGY